MSQDIWVCAGQVLCVHHLSGVFQPHQHVVDEAVAAPGVTRQPDLEARLESELCQRGGGQILQAVVSQVEVTQRGLLQSQVLDGDEGVVLQAEAAQVGEAGEGPMWKKHQVIVGQVQSGQLEKICTV